MRRIATEEAANQGWRLRYSGRGVRSPRPPGRPAMLTSCATFQFTAACARAVVAGLTAAGHEVRWRTIYNYAPSENDVVVGETHGTPYTERAHCSLTFQHTNVTA